MRRRGVCGEGEGGDKKHEKDEGRKREGPTARMELEKMTGQGECCPWLSGDILKFNQPRLTAAMGGNLGD